MRGPVALVGTVAVLSAAVIGTTGNAIADSLPLPTPLPSLTTSPLPTVSTTPLPLPSVSSPAPNVPLPTGGAGSTGSGSGSAGTGSSGSTAAGPAGAKAQPASPASRVKPMVAGNPAAVAALRDDEASPAMHRAAENFLRADQGILAITRAQQAMYALRAQAQQVAASYRGFGAEIVQARATADDLLQRQQEAARSLASAVRAAYRTGGVAGAGGGPDLASIALVGGGDQDALGLVGVTGRLEDSLTRAELRVGWVSDRQAAARADFEQLSVQYDRAAKALADANARLNGLAAARAAALSQVQAAKSSDLALNRARLAASGNLGAQIRAAVAALARSGRTITGTGSFTRPGRGSVTSPFGMRYHPILHYVKLHTGTDFAPANGIAYAADNGRVLFTMVSPAYGNMTVIDHGIVHGKHITTLYCHQARFLVREGQVVHKGQPIGIIGATGWATGPHLHFEVRDDGVPVNPMAWL